MSLSTKLGPVLDAMLRLTLKSSLIVPGPELYDLIRSVRRSQDDVDQQVREAVDALSRSSQLIDSLGNTLREREAKVRELQAEYQRVSHLASLTAEQGEAVAKSLEQVLGRTQTKERVIAFFINIIAGLILFVLGVFASDWVKGLPSKVLGNVKSEAVQVQ